MHFITLLQCLSIQHTNTRETTLTAAPSFISESFAAQQDSRGLESYTNSTKKKKINTVTETRKQFSADVLYWETQSPQLL